MKLFVVGLSYKTAPVEVRELLALNSNQAGCYGCRLKLGGGLSELVLVSTCNRVEIYGVTSNAGPNLCHLFEWLYGGRFDFSPYVYIKEGLEALSHLFRVAAGLDSMVLGETEIIGQVKQSYLNAQSARWTGPVTNRWFQTALQVAKRIRTETGIGRGSTSVGSVAVDLAERIFDRDLSSRTVMIVGAGKMGEACIKHLAKKGARSTLVANRSFEKAAKLAQEVGGEAIRFEDWMAALVRADIVVSSTGAPHTILHRKDLEGVMPGRRNRPLFLIDIAVPRDIDEDVEHVNNVFLYNVDHLEAIVRENVRMRERDLAICEEIIGEEAGNLISRWQRPRTAPLTVLPEAAMDFAGAQVA
jgi:glutamyl-tRNA reductase